MCVIQIGELAGNISEDFREKHTEIPWRQLRGLRNIYAHNIPFLTPPHKIHHKTLVISKIYCYNVYIQIAPLIL